MQRNFHEQRNTALPILNANQSIDFGSNQSVSIKSTKMKAGVVSLQDDPTGLVGTQVKPTYQRFVQKKIGQHNRALAASGEEGEQCYMVNQSLIGHEKRPVEQNIVNTNV